MNAFNKETYIKRRESLKSKVGSGVILLLGNEESSMNFKDNWYPFRQDSTFLYYFGIDLPGMTAIIDLDEGMEILFGDDLSIDHIVWTGPQLTVSELAKEVGVNKTLPADRIKATLSKNTDRKIHFLPPYRPENRTKLNEWFDLTISEIHSNASIELIKAIVNQRAIKSSEELVEIEKAVNISASMHLEIMKEARAGMKEHELVGLVKGKAVSAGGYLSYPVILTVNGQVLHNHYYGNTLCEGQMILCDAGAETEHHYAGDLTRTFPVGESFTPEQRNIYEIVLYAQKSAVEMLKPGVRFKDVHLQACKKLSEGLKDMGLMKGNIEEAVEKGAHAMFFQCGLGHMMGLDVHDMEDLGEQYVGYTEAKSTQFGLKSLRLGRELKAGYVLTVEPGIYIIPELIDLWGKDKKHAEFLNYDKIQQFRDFGGIRIEDNYAIIDSGSRLLGNPLVKEVKEVEAIRKESLSLA